MNNLSNDNNSEFIVKLFFESYSFHLARDAKESEEAYFQAHFKESKAAITEALAGCKNTALILGAGGGFDLPLAEFAKQFEHIILVDMDIGTTLKSVQKLPKKFRDKFSHERADLTGIFDEMGEQVLEIAEKADSHGDFMNQVLDLLPQLNRKEFSYKLTQSAFVCSSMVSSQLGAHVVAFLDKVSINKFGKQFEVPCERKRAFDNWLMEIQTGHIEELHQLVQAGGKVYFADHFSSIFWNKTTEVECEAELPGANKVQQYMRSLFSSVQEKQWQWIFYQKNSTKSGDTLNYNDMQFLAYKVTSLALIPR